MSVRRNIILNERAFGLLSSDAESGDRSRYISRLIEERHGEVTAALVHLIELGIEKNRILSHCRYETEIKGIGGPRTHMALELVSREYRAGNCHVRNELEEKAPGV
jgi:hypothetical protein